MIPRVFGQQFTVFLFRVVVLSFAKCFGCLSPSLRISGNWGGWARRRKKAKDNCGHDSDRHRAGDAFSI
jgi:hypothetical protein